MAPECGEHSVCVCGAFFSGEHRGECACTCDYVTEASSYNGDSELTDYGMCALDCSAFSCGKHARWDHDIAGTKAAGTCRCSDGYVGDTCMFARAYVISGASDSVYDG